MDIKDKNCIEFIEVLSSKSPVPGGGGAAALVGSVGIALSNMTGNLTLGKKKYAEYEGEIKSLIEKGMKIQNEMLELIQKDADAFEPLIKAYKMPSDTDDKKKLKAQMLEKESKNACSVPLEIMKKAYEGIRIHRRMGMIGNKMLISDVGCGVLFLRSVLEAGKLNVLINLHAIKDTVYVNKIKEEIDHLITEGISIADETLSIVYKGL